MTDLANFSDSLLEDSNEQTLTASLTETSDQNASLATENNTYYQSQIFTSEQNVNPLLAAAAPLFALATRLKNLPELPIEKNVLFDKLVHEIKAFTSQAQKAGFNSHIILAARYALCAFLDETILNTAWGANLNWRNENLLEFFHKETFGGEKFFVLLDRAYKDAALYSNLLELMYLCLSLGFQGKYHQDASALAKINDLLYNCIQKQQGELNKNLCVKEITAPSHTTPILRKNKWSILTIGIGVLVTVVSLTAIYTGFKNKITMFDRTLHHVSI